MTERGVPHFPLLKWWPSQALCDTEQVYLEAIKGAHTLLDVGAGDLRLKKRLQQAGFNGAYETLDTGGEFNYTHTSLETTGKNYDAILCLDVIEHMDLKSGLEMLLALSSKLGPNGRLILQTPNARCIRLGFGTDMTHLHLYNLPDLYSYLSCLGYEVKGYRVELQKTRRLSLIQSLMHAVSCFFITRILGADYGDNILIVAQRTNLVDPSE